MDKKSSNEEEQEAVKNSLFLTKNVLNNPFDAQKLGAPFRFHTEERLKSKRIIEQLFSEGKAIHNGGITLVYFSTPLATFYPAQVGFSVSKRLFKHATDRNLLKRRMREAYRLQKATLYSSLQNTDVQLALFWIYKSKTSLPFETIQQSVNRLLEIVPTKVCKSDT